MIYSNHERRKALPKQNSRNAHALRSSYILFIYDADRNISTEDQAKLLNKDRTKSAKTIPTGEVVSQLIGLSLNNLAALDSKIYEKYKKFSNQSIIHNFKSNINQITHCLEVKSLIIEIVRATVRQAYLQISLSSLLEKTWDEARGRAKIDYEVEKARIQGYMPTIGNSQTSSSTVQANSSLTNRILGPEDIEKKYNYRNETPLAVAELETLLNEWKIDKTNLSNIRCPATAAIPVGKCENRNICPYNHNGGFLIGETAVKGAFEHYCRKVAEFKLIPK